MDVSETGSEHAASETSVISGTLASQSVEDNAEESQMDPALADWFKVDDEDESPQRGSKDDDSETEPESDNMDVQDLDADVGNPDDDDWYNIPSEPASSADDAAKPLPATQIHLDKVCLVEEESSEMWPDIH